MTGVLTPRWLIDQATVLGYRPSEAVKDLSRGSGLSQHGQWVFYAATPQVDQREQFNDNCANVINEMSIVLACYTGQIYVYDVTDERISGVKYVSAAHEMLHAAYDRLPWLERYRVDSMLKRELSLITNERILELIKIYDTTEPGQQLNELHSILGTEVRNLSPELEAYYARYFTDRMMVVGESEHYEAVFTQMSRRADELSQQIEAQSDSIEKRRADYEAKLAALNVDITTFNRRASTDGGFASQAAFNRARQSLVGRSNALNAEMQQLNADIDHYNQMVLDLQALGRDAEALQNNMNSQSNVL
jgi:hypothetical protein